MPSRKKCCVPDCISNKTKSKLTYHRLPTNKLLAEKWLQTFANSKTKVFKSSRFCGRHFETHQYKNLHKNMLKTGVIPVLYMPKPTTNALQTNLETILPNNSLEDTTSGEHSPKLNENSSESSSIPVKSYDFNKTCRICLLEKPDLRNMDSDSIQNMFQSSDILKFSANDSLPKHICAVCLAELKVVYNFSLKCGKSSDIFRKFADKSGNSEPIVDGCVDRKGLSQTIEVSYVPTDAELRNNENKHRTYKYKLVAVDNMRQTDVSSLVSLAQLKATPAIAEKPLLTSTVQAFEVQSSKLTKHTIDSSENENTLSLDNNSTNPSASLRNKYINIILANKSGAENSRNLSKKRVLRKRKSKANATEQSKEAELPSKTQAVVPTARNIILDQETVTSVADLMEERVVHHSRPARRQSRTAGRISRRSRSRSRRSKSRTRTLRYSTRKKVASGNAVYWYDKPRDPTVNQLSKAVENANEGLEQPDTSTACELLGFHQKGTSIVDELKGGTGGKRVMADTIGNSTGSDERNVGSGGRTAVLAERTGLVERIAGSAERNADVDERNAGSVERHVGSTVTTGLAERIASSVETTAQTVMDAHSVMNKTQVKQNATILKSEPTNINIDVEKITNVVNIPKRGRGRPRKHPVLPTVKLETACSETLCINKTATQRVCKIEKCKSEKDNSNNLILKNKKCKSENDISGNVITKNKKCKSENDNTHNLSPKNEKCNIKNDNTNKITIKNEKCNIENDFTGNVVVRNEKGDIKIDSTHNLIPKNAKCNTENTITTKCNIKPGNRVNRTSKKFKAANRNTKLGTAVTNITENNNSTIFKEERTVSKTDAIIGNTADQLPTVEPVTSTQDYQHNNDKITKETNTSIDVVENEVIYMKLRHKNVKYSPGFRKRYSLNSYVNIKHLHISNKEFNKLLNVKLELNKFKVKYNKEGNNNRSKIGISKKKVRIFNKTTTENGRILRSSKTKTCGNDTSNVKNTKLAKDSILQNVGKLHVNGDKNKKINVKTTEKVSGFKKSTLNVKSYEDVEPEQLTCLENTCRVNKMEDKCCANATFKDQTDLENIADEATENKSDNTFAQINANVNATEPCKNIKTEHDKCSPDTTTKHDTFPLDNKADLPKGKVENEGLLNNSTDFTKYSVDSKPEIDSQNTVTEHAYSLLEDTQDSVDCKTECLPNAIEQNSSANNVIDLEKTPEKNPIVNNTDNETKSQLIELLHEFVVFDQNRISSTADEHTDVPTEEYTTKNYYQLLDGTIQSVTDNAQVINSDAMLSTVLKLTPELKPGVPTVYENELNESFEISINNILNTECNTVCDGQLVGSGIVLEDVAGNEEVLPTETVLYQPAQSPKFKTNCDSVYFNKRSGMIVTSVPAEETSNYSSEEEYHSSRLHSAWVPIVQPVTESPRILFEPVPSTSDANVVIKHNRVVIPSSTAVEQNFPYQCKVCKIVCNTKEQLNMHTIYTQHVTKRFCKYCKLAVDLAEFDAHVKLHENEVYCCEVCGEMVYEFSKFLRHSRIHRRHKCQLCPMEFETKLLMNQHLTIHTGVRRDQCRYCHRNFGRTAALIKHLAARTCLKKKETFICTVCKEIFNSKKKTMKHVGQHQRFKCTICNKTFSTEKYCMNHLKLAHGITETT